MGIIYRPHIVPCYQHNPFTEALPEMKDSLSDYWVKQSMPALSISERPPAFRSCADALAIIGIRSMGKSSMLERCLSQYDRCIVDTKYNGRPPL